MWQAPPHPGKAPLTLPPFQDTQEFLRCLMDQLHEELKEPVVAAAAALAEARDSDLSDSDEKREGDRSPSEDEFLSCDSSSDRGEGDGQGRGGVGSQPEAELLIADEAGRAISEKERMKDRKFSWGQQRTSSEQVDEDADVDTALDQQPPEAQPPSPRSTSPCRTPGTSQPPGSPGRVSRTCCVSGTGAQSCHPRGGFYHETQPRGEQEAEVQTHGADEAGAGFGARPGPLSLPHEHGVLWAQTGVGGGRSRPRSLWEVLVGPLPDHGLELAWRHGPAQRPLCPQSPTTRPTCAARLGPAAPSTTTRATPSWPAALPARAP